MKNKNKREMEKLWAQQAAKKLKAQKKAAPPKEAEAAPSATKESGKASGKDL